MFKSIFFYGFFRFLIFYTWTNSHQKTQKKKKTDGLNCQNKIMWIKQSVTFFIYKKYFTLISNNINNNTNNKNFYELLLSKLKSKILLCVLDYTAHTNPICLRTELLLLLFVFIFVQLNADSLLSLYRLHNFVAN